MLLQDGTEVYFKIERNTALGWLMTVYAQRQGGTPDAYRFIFGGNRIVESATPDTLEMEDDDVIDAMVEQDIGTFAEHHGSPGAHFLRGPAAAQLRAAAPADAVDAVILAAGGKLAPAAPLLHVQPVLGAAARRGLIAWLDAAHAGEVDLAIGRRAIQSFRHHLVFYFYGESIIK